MAVREHDCVEQFGGDREESGNSVICKYCRERDLHWENVDGKYTLLHKNGRVHRCNRFISKPISLGENKNGKRRS